MTAVVRRSMRHCPVAAPAGRCRKCTRARGKLAGVTPGGDGSADGLSLMQSLHHIFASPPPLGIDRSRRR